MTLYGNAHFIAAAAAVAAAVATAVAAGTTIAANSVLSRATTWLAQFRISLAQNNASARGELINDMEQGK